MTNIHISITFIRLLVLQKVGPGKESKIRKR
jgi:hypothetical protein